jgi:hypothetical protein
MFWGDSFLPTDNGEIFGLCGDVNSGIGGVLEILRNNTNIKTEITSDVADNTIIMPWIYSQLDGFEREPSCNSIIKIDKIAEAKFLDHLGYKWIPSCGEDGAEDYFLGDNPVLPPRW